MKHKSLVIFIIVTTILVMSDELKVKALSTSWSSPFNISNTAAFSWPPAVATDKQGNVHVVWSDRDSGVFTIFHTISNGTAWSSPTTVDQGFTTPHSIATDNSGRLHIAYIDLDSQWLYYRVFDGSTWSFPVLISDRPGSNSRVSITLDSGDVPHVVWDNYNGGYTVYYTKRNGTDWMDPQSVAGNAYQPRIAVDRTGSVHIVWHDRGSLKVNYGQWDGQSFVSAVTLSNSAAYNPDIAVDAFNNMHIVWESRGVGDIYYRGWNGQTWSSGTNVSNTSFDANLPSLTVDSIGNLHLVWEQATNNWEVLYSKREGSTWTPHTNISQNSATSAAPVLAFGGNSDLHVVWHDDTPGANRDIFYSKLVQPGHVISGSVSDGNNPIPNVKITTDNGVTTFTDTLGNYTLKSLADGEHFVTASKDGYVFSSLFDNPVAVPTTVQKDFTGIHCSSQNQWFAEYYENRDLIDPPDKVQCDSDIDFMWDKGKPAAVSVEDNFSVRWKRTVQFTESGWYHFRAFTDDGLRLYIDGETIIDDWVAQTFHEQSTIKKLNAGPHEVVLEYVEWSERAMARLTWYRTLLCSENAIECSLPMDVANFTPRYQTSYHGPMPTTCPSAPLKDPNTGALWVQTFARLGCKVTSSAMALSSLGIHVTPNELNQWLSESGEYLGECNGRLRSTKSIPNVILAHTNKKVKWNPTNNAQDILRNQRLPVIMKVEGGAHYILATDIVKSQNIETLGIYDPHHSYRCNAALSTIAPPTSNLTCGVGPLEHATTQQEELVYREYRGTSEAQGYFTLESGDTTPSLQFNVTGAEILLADALNRRTGYNPVSTETVMGIPVSDYWNAEITPYGAEPSGTIQRALSIDENADGRYRLQVFGTTTGIQAAEMQVASGFEVIVVGFDENYQDWETTISGEILPGESVDYQVIFNPDNETLIAALLVEIDIRPGSEDDSINCNNKNGVITVAILTTPQFSALTVDHTTVTFEGAHETHIDKKSGQPRRHEEDVDGDGDMDLVFHFRFLDTTLTCESTVGQLSGSILSGVPIIGTDDVHLFAANNYIDIVERNTILYLPLVVKD